MPSSRLPAATGAGIGSRSWRRGGELCRRLFDGVRHLFDVAGAFDLDRDQLSRRPPASRRPRRPSSAIRARDRRGDLDRRLVGHHVGQHLVLDDLVADLDVPFDDLGLGDAFADVGQLDDT